MLLLISSAVCPVATARTRRNYCLQDPQQTPGQTGGPILHPLGLRQAPVHPAALVRTREARREQQLHILIFLVLGAVGTHDDGHGGLEKYHCGITAAFKACSRPGL